jgi:hypothetical protein
MNTYNGFSLRNSVTAAVVSVVVVFSSMVFSATCMVSPSQASAYTIVTPQA